MRRTTIPVLAVLLLGACSGNDPGDDVAADPEGSPTSSQPSTPTATPTVGTYPAFAHDDYTFTVVVACFCPDAGDPIRITVVGGEATEAAWVTGHAGEEVPDYWAGLTLADVIDAANDTDAATVTVEWPSGQEYPDSVWVDQDERMVDEELGYTIRNVVVR